MSSAKDEIVRLLRKVATRAEVDGPVPREARPKRRRPVALTPPLEDERVEPIATEIVVRPPNVVEFPHRRTAVDAWLSRDAERNPLTGREWISQRSRGERSITEDLEGKTY